MKAKVSISVTPGIGNVVVGPIRATLLDKPFRIVHEVLEAPVVKVGHRQRHQASRSSGIT